MALQFYFGSSGSGKSTAVYKHIVEWSKKEPERNFMILVPDQFTMQTQKELCLLNGGIMNIDVLSFSRLTYRIFEEIGKPDRVALDDTGKNLIIRKVAAKREPDLKLLGRHLKQVGYIHEIKSVISEFMQYAVSPKEVEQLITYGTGKGGLPLKLADLNILYKEFLDFLKEKYITTEESLDLLAQSLYKSKLIKNSVVVFDGFTGFTPVQNRLIKELLRQAADVIMTITIDAFENPYVTDGEHKLFYLSQKTVSVMEKLAKEAGVARKKDVWLKSECLPRFSKSRELAHLEKNLFRQRKSIFSGENESVFICEAANPREEVQRVCVQIKDLIRKEGYCYRDIAVIAGDLAAYGHVLERECLRYDIPVYIDQTNGILGNPMVAAVDSAIQIVLFGFSYDSVFQFLKTGITDLSFEEIHCLENYVRTLGIRGRAAYEKPFVRRTKSMGEETAVEELAGLNQSREKLMLLLTPLLDIEKQPGEAKYPASRLVKAVYDFCFQMKLQEKMEQLEQDFIHAGELARAKEYGQVYPLVMDLFNQIYELLKDETMTWQEFSDILTAGFSELKVGTIPQNADQVMAGDMERTRLRQVKAVFFVGMNDNAILGGAKKGGLISDMEREFLQGSGMELAPTGRQQMFIQRFYLYLNLTKPSEKLYLSFSRVDSEGKASRPAYLIDVIKGLYPMLTVLGEQEAIEDKIAARKDGLDDFAALMGKYGQGLLEENPKEKKDFFTLYQFYGKEAMAKGLVDAAFYEYIPSSLSKEAARLIYGNSLESSVSRMEQFAACGYAHFVKYGLMLKEEEEFSFEAVDMGNVFHAVLEGFSDYLKEQETTWFQFTKEQSKEYVTRKLTELSVEYGETVLLNSARNAYILKRMERILNRTIDTLQYQLKKGVFEPKAFEIPFSMVSEFDEKTMKIRGRIDRVDTVEKDGTVYVKVMDYKSGNVKFDPVALYYGLQMQLVLYMNSALAMEKKNHPDKKIEPAALLYYQMTDPYVERSDEVSSKEQIEEAIRLSLRPKGMLLENDEVVKMLDASFDEASDVIMVERKKGGGYKAASSTATAEEIKTVSQYAELKIKEIASEILKGSIPVNPYERENKTPCAYCKYHGICGFDKKVNGFEYKKLEPLSKEKAMEKMEEALTSQEE